jgi:hypothetical protein
MPRKELSGALFLSIESPRGGQEPSNEEDTIKRAVGRSQGLCFLLTDSVQRRQRDLRSGIRLGVVIRPEIPTLGG